MKAGNQYIVAVSSYKVRILYLIFFKSSFKSLKANVFKGKCQPWGTGEMVWILLGPGKICIFNIYLFATWQTLLLWKECPKTKRVTQEHHHIVGEWNENLPNSTQAVKTPINKLSLLISFSTLLCYRNDLHLLMKNVSNNNPEKNCFDTLIVCVC